MLISLCHTSRGRPKLALQCFEQWVDKQAAASHAPRVEHVLTVDQDDPCLEQYADTFRGLVCGGLVDLHIVHEPFYSTRGWNEAAREARGHVLVMVSDDFEPPQDWDLEIQERVNRAGGVNKQLVLGVGAPIDPRPGALPNGSDTGDGKQTIYIATREYVNRCGYFLYPGYPILYVDDDVTQKAVCDDVLTDDFDLCFTQHWQGTDADETSRRQAHQILNGVGKFVLKSRMAWGFPDGWPTPHPFEADDFRKPYLNREWAVAKAGAEKLLEKYKKYANGRFKASGLEYIIGNCIAYGAVSVESYRVSLERAKE